MLSKYLGESLWLIFAEEMEQKLYNTDTTKLKKFSLYKNTIKVKLSYPLYSQKIQDKLQSYFPELMDLSSYNVYLKMIKILVRDGQ